jgi:predicted RNase H-like HicB family nuclease
MGAKIEYTATLPIKINKKRKWYVASCPILDVFSQGETEQIARKNLSEALILFFKSCFERGTLDAVLKQCGFQAYDFKSAQVNKKDTPDNEEYINIPISFLANQYPQSQCRA